MKLKVFRSFAIAIIFFCICSCTSTGFHFKTKNIDINFEKVEGWHEKSKIKGHTGDFSLRGNGKTPFHYTDDGRPCVKVMLKNGDKEKETYLLMDTGAPGIYITKRLREELNGTKSSYRFPVQLTGPYAKELVSNGYYFDKLEAEGFCINNILMQDLDLVDGNYGSSKEEGFVTEGILGVEALMKSNVLISYSTDELCFFPNEKKFDGKTIKLKKSFLKKNRVNTTFCVKNKKYDGYIDTGANAVYLHNKVLKQLEKNISLIVTERYEKTDMRYCLINDVDFLNNSFDAVPVWNENTKGQFERNITIGNSLLKAYDIYIDWNKCEIAYMKHNEYKPDFNLEKYITDNEKGLFGIGLNKHGNKWLVVAKYYINEKPMIEGVGVGDELLSVNGIKINNFDWESWSDLDEADFEFLHNGEIISKKLIRRHIDEFRSHEIEIPFKIEKDGRIILTFLNEDNEYLFFLDSASTNNVLFQNGYEKASQLLGIDITEKLESLFKENNPTLSYKEIKELARNYINSGGLKFTLKDLRNNDFVSQPVSFVYMPEEYSTIDFARYDGLINLDFFGQVENILIDYKKKKIIINSSEKLENRVRMERFNVLKVYAVDVSINGVKQQALLDTSASLFFLREQYKNDSRVSEEQLLKLLETDISDTHKEEKINAELEIGNYKTKITGVLPDMSKYDSTNSGKRVIQELNLLGYSVFKNHRIQFDFQRMEFGIE